MGNIMKKKQSDERFAITQLTEKALAKHNLAKCGKLTKWPLEPSEKSFGSEESMISLTTDATS